MRERSAGARATPRTAMSADMFSLSIPALEIRGWSSTSRAAGRRPARCSVAGIPAGVEFATKPALAVAILRGGDLPGRHSPTGLDEQQNAALGPRRRWTFIAMLAYTG